MLKGDMKTSKPVWFAQRPFNSEDLPDIAVVIQQDKDFIMIYHEEARSRILQQPSVSQMSESEMLVSKKQMNFDRSLDGSFKEFFRYFKQSLMTTLKFDIAEALSTRRKKTSVKLQTERKYPRFEVGLPVSTQYDLRENDIIRYMIIIIFI